LLHFIECHRGRLLRIKITFGLNTRKRRPRKEMNFSHHGADQSLDVAAVVGLLRRPP